MAKRKRKSSKASGLEAFVALVKSRVRWVVSAVVLALVAWASTSPETLTKPARAAVVKLNNIPQVESYAEVIREAAEEFELDPYLLAGMMLSESGGQLDAVSKAEALGLFQLQLPTARDMAARMRLEPPSREDLLSDALLNARLCGRYLVWLGNQFDGELKAMLVGYNAGPGRLRGWTKEAGGFDAWWDERKSSGTSGIVAYVEKVQHYRDVFAERGNISPSH